MPLPQITIDGWIHEADLRFSPNGKAVCSVRVRCGEKKRDDGTYGDSLWVSTSLWEADAEAAAEAFKQGDPVCLTGVLHQRQYEKQDGTKGTSLDVKWARLSKPVRGQQSSPQRQASRPPLAPAPDPWASAAPGSGAPTAGPPF